MCTLQTHAHTHTTAVYIVIGYAICMQRKYPKSLFTLWTKFKIAVEQANTVEAIRMHVILGRKKMKS